PRRDRGGVGRRVHAGAAPRQSPPVARRHRGHRDRRRSVNAVLARLRGGLVYTRGALATLPAPRDPAPFRIREMDMTWPSDVAAWLDIHNDAFDRAWGTVDYARAILDHPYIRVLHTFFALDGDRP